MIYILFLLLFDLNFQRLVFLHQIWQEESYLGDLQCQAGQAPRPTHQQMCSTRRTLKEHCVFIFFSLPSFLVFVFVFVFVLISHLVAEADADGDRPADGWGRHQAWARGIFCSQALEY